MSRSLTVAAIIALTLPLGNVAHAFPGAPVPCPANAKNEVALIPAARRTTTPDSPCNCETIISCMNLDKKTHTVTCQFFGQTTLEQRGVDAPLTLNAGQTDSCATSSTDPLGIRFGIGATANIPDQRKVLGRVCSDTKNLACDAAVSCDCATTPHPGPVVEPLVLIIKKQKGS